MTMIHFKVIPGLAVAWRQLPGDGPVLLPAASVRRGLVDGGGHGLLGVPQLALSVSSPDDRQAVRLQPYQRNGRARTVLWQFLGQKLQV